MEPIRKAGALIISNKRLLIVKPRGKLYCINPGGKYKGDENTRKCLERELSEELTIRLTDYRHYKTYEISKAAHDDNPLSLKLYFVEFSGNIKASGEIESFEWMSGEDFYNRIFNTAPSFDEYMPDLIKDGFL